MTTFTRVADFMTPDPHWIALDENLATAESQMKSLHVRQLPVMHDGRLRGTISERDVALVRALEVDPRNARAGALRREHTLQRLALDRALAGLDEQYNALLATSVEDVLLDILHDMDREEAEVLTLELLGDGVTQPAAISG